VGSLHRVWLTAKSGPSVELIARTIYTRTPSASRNLISGFAFMWVQLPETRDRIDQLIAALKKRKTEAS
jgi:hypothetical protein